MLDGFSLILLSSWLIFITEIERKSETEREIERGRDIERTSEAHRHRRSVRVEMNSKIRRKETERNYKDRAIDSNIFHWRVKIK